jgi:hypothetical protein
METKKKVHPCWDAETKEFSHMPDLSKAVYHYGMGYIVVPCETCGETGTLSGTVEWDDTPEVKHEGS